MTAEIWGPDVNLSNSLSRPAPPPLLTCFHSLTLTPPSSLSLPLPHARCSFHCHVTAMEAHSGKEETREKGGKEGRSSPLALAVDCSGHVLKVQFVIVIPIPLLVKFGRIASEKSSDICTQPWPCKWETKKSGSDRTWNIPANHLGASGARKGGV